VEQQIDSLKQLELVQLVQLVLMEPIHILKIREIQLSVFHFLAIQPLLIYFHNHKV
jgi:hypothetical protein